MKKEMTDREVEPYKYLNKNVKCPECGRTMVTYNSEDIEGNYFCFYDDCEFDQWVTELCLARTGFWKLPKDGYDLIFGDITAKIYDSNKHVTDVNYIITFNDERYKGLSAGGDTVDEAIEMAGEVLKLVKEMEGSDKSSILSEQERE